MPSALTLKHVLNLTPSHHACSSHPGPHQLHLLPDPSESLLIGLLLPSCPVICSPHSHQKGHWKHVIFLCSHPPVVSNIFRIKWYQKFWQWLTRLKRSGRCLPLWPHLLLPLPRTGVLLVPSWVLLPEHPHTCCPLCLECSQPHWHVAHRLTSGKPLFTFRPSGRSSSYLSQFTLPPFPGPHPLFFSFLELTNIWLSIIHLFVYFSPPSLECELPEGKDCICSSFFFFHCHLSSAWNNAWPPNRLNTYLVDEWIY